MKITLKHHTPLHIASSAIRTCWASEGKSDTDLVPFLVQNRTGEFNPPNNNLISCGPNDRALINRVGNKYKHASTLEHLSYSFYIEDISRACLQELARHRISSFSVKSSRYTLKELKNTESIEDCKQFLVQTDDEYVNDIALGNLLNVRKALQRGVSNDKAKYALPEAYKTTLTWTINARALQNFLALRTSPAALWEIRELALAIYAEIPAEHKYLFTDSLYTKEIIKNCESCLHYKLDKGNHRHYCNQIPATFEPEEDFSCSYWRNTNS